MNPTSRKLIGQILCENGYLKQSQIEHALTKQKEGKHRRLGQILLDFGYITMGQLNAVLALQAEQG